MFIARNAVVFLLVAISTHVGFGQVINEILADPPDDVNADGDIDPTDDEFIEIVNDSGVPVDMSNWTVSNQNAPWHVFPAGTIVNPGQAILVFGGGLIVQDFGGAVVQIADDQRPGLRIPFDNNGDTITLANAAATVVSSHTYGAEGGFDQSLTRDPDVTGSFTLHTTATGSLGEPYSPGTQIDGTPFDAGIDGSIPTATTWGLLVMLLLLLSAGTLVMPRSRPLTSYS